MKQVVCECGRIAEVRRRKNGQRLRYKHCAKCGTNLGGAESARLLEEKEQDDIGVFGEMADGSYAAKAPSVEAPKPPAENPSPDWVPDAETQPEISEPAISEKPSEEPEEKPGSLLKVVACGLAVAGAVGLGVGALKLKNPGGGA